MNEMKSRNTTVLTSLVSMVSLIITVKRCSLHMLMVRLVDKNKA